MIPQTIRLNRFNPKSSKDIMNAKAFRNNKALTLVQSLKALSMFIDIVVENMLNGYKHTLPEKLGDLYVVKRHIENSQNKNEKSNHKYHPRHIFSFAHESEHVDRCGMRFKASTVIINKLNKRLELISTDYRLKDGIG